ncbi:hypothetical protein ABT093_11800 [Kitasatospora sp. NPDC002551]|uniref:hypothetical protein n=1 Tax=Kitasatospora sp. NPDC002551 TaxID=3154539 RepID=UPI00332D8D1A
MSFTTTEDGTPVFSEDRGSGRPVVIGHGRPLNGDAWAPQARPVAEHGLRAVVRG